MFGQLSPLVGGICISATMGEVPFSVLGVIEPINLVFYAIACLGGVGCGITISKCSGSGDRDVAARVFTRAVIALSIVTVALSVVVFAFADPLLRFLRATPDNIGYAHEYLNVILIGSLPVVLMLAGDYILTDDNDPVLVLVGYVVSCIVNIVGNLVCLGLLGLGIWSSALSMVLGDLAACVIFLRHFKKRDSLCRFVMPERREGDPSLPASFSPGTPMALMYVMYAAQILVSNFVLAGEAGTSGLGNATVIELLIVFLTIFIDSVSEPVMPLVSSYFGEGNRTGTLLVKRSLFQMGMHALVPIVAPLVLFPQAFITPFSVKDPLMLETLPLAIRIVCINALFTFTNNVMVSFLAATERERLANVSYGIQITVNIAATLALSGSAGMDAPWYGAMAASICSFAFLLVAGRLSRGFIREYPENALVLVGGTADEAHVAAWRDDTVKVLGRDRADVVWDKLIGPFLASEDGKAARQCSYTIIERDNGDTAAILRYGGHTSLRDLLVGDEGEKEDLSHVYGECVSSEFNTLRRLMVNFRG